MQSSDQKAGVKAEPPRPGHCLQEAADLHGVQHGQVAEGLHEVGLVLQGCLEAGDGALQPAHVPQHHS